MLEKVIQTDAGLVGGWKRLRACGNGGGDDGEKIKQGVGRFWRRETP